MTKICEFTNDEIIIKTYNRLSPLEISKQSINSYKKIQSGDCIIAFSRKNIYQIKNEIEKLHRNNNIKCFVI